MLGKFENVKIGDKMLLSNRGREEIALVNKVTETRFSCGYKTFLKKNGKEYGGDRYLRTKVSLATEQDCIRIKENKEKRKLSYILNNTSFHTLKLETLKKIFALIELENV